MIKEVLQQLEPLDAQIDALCSSTDDAEMANTTTHAAELAELSAQENMLLKRCTSLTPEDRVFLARALTARISAKSSTTCLPTFLSSAVTGNARRTRPFCAVSRDSMGCPLRFWGTAKERRWKKTCAATLACRDRKATARRCA